MEEKIGGFQKPKSNCHRYLYVIPDYYHCVSSGGCRYRANYTNESFVEELKKFKPHPGVVELYKVIISNAYKKQTSQQQHAGKQLIDEINKVNERITKARELLLSEDIDPIDYRSIRKESDIKLTRLEAKLAENATTTGAAINIDKLIEKLFRLSHILILFTPKQTLQGSVK